jgi:hypothetical protein
MNVTIVYDDGALMLVAGVRSLAKLPSEIRWRASNGSAMQDWFPSEVQLTGSFGVMRLSATRIKSLSVRTPGGKK